MCSRNYTPPEMFPYVAHDRENALRLIAQERWDMMMSGRRGSKNERRSAR